MFGSIERILDSFDDEGNFVGGLEGEIPDMAEDIIRLSDEYAHESKASGCVRVEEEGEEDSSSGDNQI